MNINIKQHNIKAGDEIMVPKSGWNLSQHALLVAILIENESSQKK